MLAFFFHPLIVFHCAGRYFSFIHIFLSLPVFLSVFDPTGDVLEEELQSHSLSVSLMTPSSAAAAAAMASGMDMPRKRKGSMDNQ